jgi:pimeloyl-ACP methyl ester carboxylesterase
MLVTLTIFASLLALPERLATEPLVTPGEFRAWFDKASEGRFSVPGDVERGAGRFRYVFVGGFHNERRPGYFVENARELRNRGIDKRLIDFLYPSSDETIEGNAEAIRSRLFEIGRKGPEKMVVIAHSRGACDALAFALRNPGFVQDRIQALFLVQGSFGGTGVADYVMGEGPPMDSRMPLRYRILACLLGRIEKLLLDRGRHGGLRGLTRSASHDFWARTLDEHSGAIAVVGPKTFFITSTTRPSRLRLFERTTAWYLQTYYGKNDGMVVEEDQSLPSLGTVLARLEAGHSELTNRLRSTRTARRLQRALIDGILMTVGRPAPGLPGARICPAAAGSSGVVVMDTPRDRE